MTRNTLFRIILAVSMLPNVSAYHWLLPRKMKRYIGPPLSIVLIRLIRPRFENFLGIHAAMFGTDLALEPINATSFRLPVNLQP